MILNKTKTEGFSVSLVVASVATLIASERAGITAFDASPNGVFMLIVLICFFVGSAAFLYSARFSLKSTMLWNAIMSFQLLYLLTTAYSYLIVHRSYGDINIISWILFLVVVLGISVALNRRFASSSDIYDLNSKTTKFGLLFLVFALLALALGLKRDVMGLDDFQALYSGSVAIVSLPTFSSNNAGAAFLAIVCLRSVGLRIYPLLMAVVVAYLLYIGARMALLALLFTISFQYLSGTVRRLIKWPILLLPIAVIPIVILYGGVFFEPGSIYGALNGRQTIRTTSLLGVQNLDVISVFFGSGMFGHFATNNYNFEFMFPSDSGVQLMHNLYLQVFFDLGLVGVFLILFIIKRLYEFEKTTSLLAVFISVSASTETILLPYYPEGFIFLTLIYMALQKQDPRKLSNRNLLKKAGSRHPPEFPL